MGTGRTLHKKPRTRPVKSVGARRRRHLVQKRRLIALGVAEDVVGKLNIKEARDILKRPALIEKAVATQAVTE